MAYANYLATTTFRSGGSSFGNVSGLGTTARTAAAVLLGGPRAGAGSAYRVYTFLQNNNPRVLQAYLARAKAIAQRNAYNLNQFNRQLSFNLG